MSVSKGPVRTRHLQSAKSREEPIIGFVAHDYNMARLLDLADADLFVVSRQAGVDVFGYSSDSVVSLEEMVTLARGVARGAHHALVVADLPFGCYEANAKQSLLSAIQIMKSAGVAAVRLEGGQIIDSQISAVVSAGIPVMGHLRPRSESDSPLACDTQLWVSEAIAVESSGAFALTLEGIPSEVAVAVAQHLRIPVLGFQLDTKLDGVLEDPYGWAGLRPIDVAPSTSSCSIAMQLSGLTDQLRSSWRERP